MKLRKIFSLVFLCTVLAALCVLLRPITANAVWQDGFYYTESGGTAIITGYRGTATDVVVPSELGGYRVDAIYACTFKDCDTLISVTIPDSVTYLEAALFKNCAKLTSVVIGNGLIGINSELFYGCSSLTDVTIGSSIKYISRDVFDGCSSLTNVYVDPSTWCKINFSYSSFNPMVLTDKLHFLDENGNVVTDVVLDSTVTEIPDYAFYDSTITSVTIPSSITSIGALAFAGCYDLTDVYITNLGAWWEISFYGHSSNPMNYADNLHILDENGNEETYVYLSYTVKSIPDYAFKGCTNLQKVSGGSNVTSIGTSAFSGCANLKTVTIGSKVTSIGDHAFSNCSSLTSMTIPNSVTTIGDDAFSNCSSLTSMTIPNSVTTIGDDAFSYCTSLTGIWVDANNPNYSSDDHGVLFNKDKTTLIVAPGGLAGSYTIPGSVTTIGDDAFSYCTSLTGVTIPDSVTTIGDDAFSYCTSLTGVTIPDSVTTIGNEAFYYCKNLTGIWVDEKNTNYSSDSYGVLFNKGKTTLIQAPGGISGDYTIPDSVTSIGDDAFSYCTSLTGVTIPDSVTTIGDAAFYNCKALTSVTIGNSVITIGSWAFYCCSGLTNVYYAGSQSRWNAISIGSGNSCLTSATVYYNHAHDYTLIPPVQVDPTCTEDGYIEYICAFGDTYREILPALGHNYVGVVSVIPPTCTERGYTLTQCTRCKKIEKTNFTDALNHSYSGTVTVTPPTCTEQGNTVTQCARCDSIQTTYQSKLGHDYSGTVTVTSPTCMEEGFTTTQCIRCESTVVSDYTDTVAHKMVLAPAVAPTCMEPGLTAGTKCQWCGMVGVAQKEVAATGNHDYTENQTTCGSCGFVRAELGITSVVLRPTVSGIYFKGVFALGEGVTAQRQGIAVSVVNTLPVADDSDPTSLYTNGYNSALIKNILDSSNGKTIIYARAYILLEDGTYIYGDVVETCLYQVVLAVESQWDSLTDAQKAAIKEMYNTFASRMKYWEIPKIKEYLPA